jgi:O-antigen/teichoic acid export membrane protein
LDTSSSKLIKGTSVFTISKILTKAGTILLLPIYTRLLSPAEYGIIGLLQPIINFIPLFFVFGLYVAQMRYYVEYEQKNEIKSFIFTLNIFLWIINVIIFGVLVSPFGEKIIGFIIDYEKVSFYPYILLALIIGFINVFSMMAKNYFQTVQKYKRIAISSIISFLISSVLSLILIYYFDFGVLGKLTGMLISNIFIFIVLYLKYIRNITFDFDKTKLKNGLVLGLPILINAIIGTVINYSDRIVLAQYVSMDIIGVYSLAYTGGMVLNIFTNSFNDTWRPMLYDLLESNNKNSISRLKKVFSNFIIVVSFIALLGQLFSKEIILFILPQNYNGTTLFLPYILAGMVFAGLYHFVVNILVFHKNTHMIPFFTIISALLNLGINIIFIPKFGPLVAAISTIISYIVTTTLIIIYLKIKYKIYKFNFIKDLFVLFFIVNPLLFWILEKDVSLTIFIFKIIYMSIFLILFSSEMFKFISKYYKKKVD